MLRSLPQIDKLLSHPKLRAWDSKLIARVRKRLAQDCVAEFRERVKRNGISASVDEIAEALERSFQKISGGKLRKAINATGIVLHTNLGRAPLGKRALKNIERELSGYCTLEVDVEKQTRGSRTLHAEECLKLLLGSEEHSAAIVNNNAAAVLLALSALGRNKEVIVSRSEIVQIGGGFRVNEILEASGCTLREVGTTNITKVQDYRRAIRQETGAILKVHQSCFTIHGHTESAAIPALAKLAHERKLPLFVDLGSGGLEDRSREEPSIQTVLKAGSDLVCFSGDKLLGGSQAGILFGKREWIERVKRLPLYRVLRIGKLELFLLEENLHQHLNGEETETDRMIRTPAEVIKSRAQKFIARAGNPLLRCVEGKGSIGGGTTPCEQLRTFLIEFPVEDSEAVARRLARNSPPIFVRKAKGKIKLDLRTVFPDEEDALHEGLSCLF